MISIYRYYEAKRMFNHLDQVVKSWGEDVPPMLQAQRDITELEMQHFKEEMKNLFTNLAIAVTIAFLLYGVYVLGDYKSAKVL
jgi:hypothetical protein